MHPPDVSALFPLDGPGGNAQTQQEGQAESDSIGQRGRENSTTGNEETAQLHCDLATFRWECELRGRLAADSVATTAYSSVV